MSRSAGGDGQTTILERKVYQQADLDQALRTAIDDILAVYEPDEIILFGSAAEGRTWHDLDLLVVAETQDRFRQRLKKIALAKTYWTPTDVLVLTPEEFAQAFTENRYFLVHEILKKGKLVYERPGRSRVAGVGPRRSHLGKNHL